MSKVNQWEGLAFSYAVMGLVMELGEEHPISGSMCKALNNKGGPMIGVDKVENISKQIVQQVKDGLIKDDLLERMLKFDSKGGLISIGQENIEEFIIEAGKKISKNLSNRRKVDFV